KATDIANGLTGQSTGGASGSTATRIQSTRDSGGLAARTNPPAVSDIPSKLEEIQSLIGKMDIPVRQVLIESRIVIADAEFGRSLGVRLGASDLRGIDGGIPGYNVGGNNYVNIGGNLNAVGAQTLQSSATGSTSSSTTGLTFSDPKLAHLPATGQNGF